MPGHEKWFLYAVSDLKAAKILFQEDQIYPSAFFLCQQSAEKALKTFLTFKQQSFRKTHDLALLLNLCIKVDPSFTQLEHETEGLNAFGVEIRYPDNLPMPDKATLKASIAEAEKILNFVEDRLG